MFPSHPNELDFNVAQSLLCVGHFVTLCWATLRCARCCQRQLVAAACFVNLYRIQSSVVTRHHHIETNACALPPTNIRRIQALVRCDASFNHREAAAFSPRFVVASWPQPDHWGHTVAAQMIPLTLSPLSPPPDRTDTTFKAVTTLHISKDLLFLCKNSERHGMFFLPKNIK